MKKSKIVYAEPKSYMKGASLMSKQNKTKPIKKKSK